MADLHAAANAAAPAGASSLDPHSQSAQAAPQNAEACRQPHAGADSAGGTAVPNGIHTQLLVHGLAPLGSLSAAFMESGEQAPAASSCWPCSRCAGISLLRQTLQEAQQQQQLKCFCMHPTTHSQQRQQQPLCMPVTALEPPSLQKRDSKHDLDICTAPVHACAY